MSSDQPGDEHANISENFENFKQTCDSLVRSLQNELDFYKVQHKHLQKEIYETKILNRNPSCSCKLGATSNAILDGAEETAVHKSLSDEVIDNLNQQIKQLIQEKESLITLWKSTEKTISNLEFETLQYRQQLQNPNVLQETQMNYEKIIKQYQVKISFLNMDLSKQKTDYQILQEAYKNQEDRHKIFEAKYQEILLQQTDYLSKTQQVEAALSTTNIHLAEIAARKAELEENLVNSKVVLQEHINRESTALRKVQEVLELAERALAEKNSAIEREKITKEECDYLASTIDSVINQAAERVEKDTERLKQEYSDKIKRLEKNMSTIKMAYEKQKKRADLEEQRANVLDDKLKRTLHNNLVLDSELKFASQQIVEMELQIEAFEKSLQQGIQTSEICDDRLHQLQEYLKSNKRLKERWVKATEEITSKLNKEIKELQSRNTELRLENEKIKEHIKRCPEKHLIDVYSTSQQSVTQRNTAKC